LSDSRVHFQPVTILLPGTTAMNSSLLSLRRTTIP
jgi:hypothetical protein